VIADEKRGGMSARHRVSASSRGLDDSLVPIKMESSHDEAIVLAYSGGLDTSVRHSLDDREWGSKWSPWLVDVGRTWRRESFEDISCARPRRRRPRLLLVDARDEMAEEFLAPRPSPRTRATRTKYPLVSARRVR